MTYFVLLVFGLLPSLLSAKCGSPIAPSAVPLSPKQYSALQQPNIDTLIKELAWEITTAWIKYDKWSAEELAQSKVRRDLLSGSINELILLGQ